MKQILMSFLTSKENGLPSLIRSKTGKISFRKSATTLVLTAMVIPDYTVHGLTYLNAGLASLCLLVLIVPYIMRSDKNNQQPL